MKESHSRSITKAITWRFIASATTMAIVYFVTKSLGLPVEKSIELTATAGVIDVVAKLTFYYMHERAWGRVQWGNGDTAK